MSIHALSSSVGPTGGKGDHVHDDRHRIEEDQEADLGLHGLSRDHPYGCAEEVEVPDEEDQGDALEGEIPEGILPYQVAAHVQQALHEDAEYRIADGPEPHLRNTQDLHLLVLGKGVIEDDAQEGEHEHDLDVPSHHGAQRRVAGRGPERAALGEVQHPPVPALVEEIHPEDGGTREDRIPVPRLLGQFDLLGIDVEHDGHNRDDVPLDHGQIPESVKCLQCSRCHT